MHGWIDHKKIYNMHLENGYTFPFNADFNTEHFLSSDGFIIDLSHSYQSLCIPHPDLWFYEDHATWFSCGFDLQEETSYRIQHTLVKKQNIFCFFAEQLLSRNTQILRRDPTRVYLVFCQMQNHRKYCAFLDVKDSN